MRWCHDDLPVWMRWSLTSVNVLMSWSLTSVDEVITYQCECADAVITYQCEHADAIITDNCECADHLPVWMRWCCWTCESCLKVLSQNLHWYLRTLECTSVCCVSCCEDGNDLKQWPHLWLFSSRPCTSLAWRCSSVFVSYSCTTQHNTTYTHNRDVALYKIEVSTYCKTCERSARSVKFLVVSAL